MAKKATRTHWRLSRNGLIVFALLYALGAYAFISKALDSGSYWHYGLGIFCIVAFSHKVAAIIKR